MKIGTVVGHFSSRILYLVYFFKSFKVHVSLRVTPSVLIGKGESSIISLDKKRRQVTIVEPQNPATQDRVGVSAPKMFAFDQIYSRDDDQYIYLLYNDITKNGISIT
ncbi:hypothetical protein Anas_10874 [Armadillidium nasatum]|uniref:Uncharacterized protein n=1 Tax=Armadillidium nasatum TaxID=96803 RepID=A0A5N5T113_9CRUS|nr:hypothetical protein Anas_10874 [Armadillidium nasatum]